MGERHSLVVGWAEDGKIQPLEADTSSVIIPTNPMRQTKPSAFGLLRRMRSHLGLPEQSRNSPDEKESTGRAYAKAL